MGIKTVFKAIKATVAQSFELNTEKEPTLMDIILSSLDKRAQAKKNRERIAQDIKMIEEHKAKYAEWLEAQAEAEAAAAREQEEALIAEELERQELVRLYWDNRQKQQLLLGDSDNKTDN